MRNSYSRYVGRRVVVQVGEDSIGGTLANASREVIELTDAALLGAHVTPMDGTVIVPLPVRWVQVA